MPVRVGLRAVVLVASLAGACTGGPVADDRRMSPGASAPALRTDREPIARRFPKLGDFRQVHWTGGTLGGSSSGRDTVPGPTTYWIRAVVVPSEADYRRFTEDFTWNGTTRPEIGGPLAKAVDPSGEWAAGPDFWTWLDPAPGTTGTVHLNRTRRYLYLSVTID